MVSTSDPSVTAALAPKTA